MDFRARRLHVRFVIEEHARYQDESIDCCELKTSTAIPVSSQGVQIGIFVDEMGDYPDIVHFDRSPASSRKFQEI